MFDCVFTSHDLALGRWNCSDPHLEWGAAEPVERHEVVVAVRGYLEREHRGEILPATSNVALLANPGEVMRFRHPDGKPDRCAVVLLGETAMEDVARMAGQVQTDFQVGWGRLPAAAYLSLNRLLFSTKTSASMDPVMAREATGSIVNALLGTMGWYDRSNKQREHRAVRQAIAFMAAEYREPLTLEGIAREAAYSPFHFARLFRRHTGLSVHSYLARLRLRTAVTALLEGEKDISGLAHRLGYASHSHFTEAFRKEFGTTPSRVRNGGTRNVRAMPPWF